MGAMSSPPAVPGSPFPDTDFPADPYPGARPACSFVHHSTRGWVLAPDTGRRSGWSVLDGSGAADLDSWLAERGEPALAERLPVLAYGSNACPEKVSWLRDNVGLEGPAVVLRAEVAGLAAVWSAGVRARDGQRPAVLTAAPGVVETHAVWFVTPRQRRALDRCEGRGERYRLSWVRGQVRLEDGVALKQVLAYTSRSDTPGQVTSSHVDRSPLLVEGQPVRCAEVDQSSAVRLRGVPAGADGVDCVEVHGEPAHVSLSELSAG